MYKKLFFLSLLLLNVVSLIAEPTLKVVDVNGHEQSYALSQIGKITFSNETMYLFAENGTLLGYTAVENVGKIVSQEPTATALNNVEGQLYIYPNPTHEGLIVKGLPVNQTIRVFDLAGRLQTATVMQENETYISVNALPNGTYLLQVGAQIVKFIKE